MTDTTVLVLDPADLAGCREDLSEPMFRSREILADDLVRGAVARRLTELEALPQQP